MPTLTIKQPSATRRATGATLVLIGGFLALHEAGLFPMFDLARGWPVFIILLALVRMGARLNAGRRQGWGLLVMGDWLFVNTMTDWAHVQLSVPLLLAAIGVAMMLRAPRNLYTMSDTIRDAVEKSLAKANRYAAQGARFADANRYAEASGLGGRDRYQESTGHSTDGNRYAAG
jgi:hypothetical protein